MEDIVPRLLLRDVSKSYPGCLANQQITLSMKPGEIQALLGENGAGKSTLMKIIYGLVRPDAGEVFWEGEEVKIDSPAVARRLGIGMVFQHFSLFERLTVAENIALALPREQEWNLSELGEKIANLGEFYGLIVNPKRPVYTLSAGERQRVEILRCLFQTKTKLLILDEPTAVLTPQETENLFTTLRQLTAEGCSILFSSHKLPEVQSLCSSATVLRQGRLVGRCNPQLESPASLTRMMIGTEVPPSQGRRQQPPGPVCLRLNDLCLSRQHPFGTPLQNISMELCTGEIVGIAGVAGNGQSELLAALSGEVICQKAEMIMLGETPIAAEGVVKRRRLGLAYAPGERLEKAVVPSLSLLENALLTGYSQGLVRRGMIHQRKLEAWARRICNLFNVKRAGMNAPAASLSGGNLQKFIIGREMLQNPAVLIAAHPSWGVDVNATAMIHEALIEMRDTGSTVLVVSEDLDELFALCDRIGAIYKGRLSPIKPIAETSRDEIGGWMGGI
ncbi:MAG: ABC transporter ATP-binding protein [Nostocaceae cyanobacterium]|nr:ABC transporter ATP-binding protein [Nostocaceae cyanobacterium]